MSPTVTTLSGQTFNSLGPLTTTFTAAASCATATNNILLFTDKDKNFFAPNCDVQTSTLGDCFPSGRRIDAHWVHPAALSAVIGGQIDYFSPGIACPSAWTTAGVAVKNTAGLLVTSSGVFTSASASLYNGAFVDQYKPNILMEAIAPGETAVLYCPSGWAFYGDSCTSTLPRVKFETGCIFQIPAEDYTFLPTTVMVSGGSAVTGDIFTLTNTHPASVTVTTSFEAAERAHWAAVSILPMVTLLQRESDPPRTSSSSSSMEVAVGSGATTTALTSGSAVGGAPGATTSSVASGTNGRGKYSLVFVFGYGLLGFVVGGFGGLYALM
ncbi:hypothetical protein OQA88_13211 [Cercophora sp. LCS_1]